MGVVGTGRRMFFAGANSLATAGDAPFVVDHSGFVTINKGRFGVEGNY
jgi:hypothetical protein